MRKVYFFFCFVLQVSVCKQYLNFWMRVFYNYDVVKCQHSK